MAYAVHFLRVAASSPEEAYRIADRHVEGFGSEDNYYKFGGSVCEDGTIHYEDEDAAFKPEEGDTFESLGEKVLNEFIDGGTDVEGPRVLRDCADGSTDIILWSRAMCYCHQKYQTLLWAVDSNVEVFDMRKDEFKAWEFDEYGVTGLIDPDEIDTLEERGLKMYIVYLSMHS